LMAHVTAGVDRRKRELHRAFEMAFASEIRAAAPTAAPARAKVIG